MRFVISQGDDVACRSSKIVPATDVAHTLVLLRLLSLVISGECADDMGKGEGEGEKRRGWRSGRKHGEKFTSERSHCLRED